MDSAHEELELPSAIQYLVQRLEGQGEPITRLPSLSEPEFREFFPERASLSESSIIGWRSQPYDCGVRWCDCAWRSQVRLRVLEAMGSCSTVLTLDVSELCGGEISRLTASEWDLVLRGSRTSTILKRIEIWELRGLDAEIESLCLQMGRILNTSSATDLCIRDYGLNARCFMNLASGQLKSLDVMFHASTVQHVADMINSAPLLETLCLFHYTLEDETVGILSQALIQSSSLKELTLDLTLDSFHAHLRGTHRVDCNWVGRLLLKALAGDDRNRSIERLWLFSSVGLGDCLKEILISNPSLKEVVLHYKMSPEEWHQLGEVIRDNVIATTIHVMCFFEDDDWKSIEALAQVKNPTVELDFQARKDHEVMLSLNLLGRVLRGEIKYLKSLRIFVHGKDVITFSILPMNGKTGETSVLKRLEISLRSEDLSKGVWEDLLRCMRGNHLTHLDLSDSQLDEEAFRDLMGVLQVNLALQEIDVSRTSWARDGKAAQLQEALRQNQERAVYMSVFREANLTFGDAKAGRLFLCGSPRAGKTQLRKTLMRLNHSWLHRSSLFNNWDVLWRTKGIEVEFLQNKDKMQISVWDLAGQWIFRTLQNVLFPQTNNFCVFVFVYSPFCEKTSLNKPDSCFKTELEDWLSFITSSIKITGRDLPQVFVVISHKDKTKYSSLSWAHSIVKKLTKRFTKFVDLRPIQECFHVDARKNKQVKPLSRHIFENFHELLREKSPQVPELCSHLTSLFVTYTKKNKNFPLWPFKKFHDFCAPQLTSFIPSSSAYFVNHSRIIESIISYLNDVGYIIYIPNIDYIIVDPNWLTNTFLGELIALGQHFQAEKSESSYRTSSYASKDGFVSESVFAGLIDKFLGKQPRFQNVDREVLEKILINLDLCFKLKDTSEYFIPSFIPEHASKEEENHQEGAHVKSMNWANRSENSQFVGIRIQCQDSRTMSLTAAFFPRLQMFMRRKLINEMGVPEENMTCSRHYLRLFLDGHQICIEHVQSEKSHKYVDVLMLCSRHKSREVATKYVMKHIVHELISFCASPKGCPGVALVLGVIQTVCVEMLIPSHLRGVILIEKLKSDFLRSINDKLEEMPLERSHLMEKEELFHYEQCWRPIESYTSERSERARDLLLESDVEAVVNEIRQNRIQQLESLQEGLISVDNDLAQCYPEAENMVSSSNGPQMKELYPPRSNFLSRSITSVENRSTQLLLSKFGQLEGKVDVLHRKVDDLDERLREVHSIMQRVDMKIEHILSVQQELQSTLSVFMSKVDRIIGYSQAFQQGKTPKRPYVTNDVGLFYRLNAGLHVGTTVRLHLMCESVSGFHAVKDQDGLKLRLDSEKWGWIRKIIEISYKVIYYGAKATLTKLFGLGEAIPTWADLESDIVKLDGISNEDRRAVLTGGESKELQEAWLRIQQILAPHLQNRYSEIFKLYQVKYVSLEKGGHAWVCERCMKKGLDCGILTC